MKMLLNEYEIYQFMNEIIKKNYFIRIMVFETFLTKYPQINLK